MEENTVYEMYGDASLRGIGLWVQKTDALSRLHLNCALLAPSPHTSYPNPEIHVIKEYIGFIVLHYYMHCL